MTEFELAVQDPRGVAAAQRIRPDRIELAAALDTGGVTPSAGLIESAVSSGVPTHVLIRPRVGGFDYDDGERHQIVADAVHAVRLGAAGVVVGGTAGGAVDADLVRRVVEVVEGREVTFHRAFDTLVDLRAGVEALAELGVRRILTSGGASNAIDALDTLRMLHAGAAGRIQLMAGGGVTSRNAAQFADAGLDAVHASAKRFVEETIPISLGAGAPSGPSGFSTTDEAEALAIMTALKRPSAP